LGAISQVQMLGTLSQKENSPVPNEQAVRGPLRRYEKGEVIIIIIIIIINFEN
jgi:hypothetical protein